jgi:ribosome-associated protein
MIDIEDLLPAIDITAVRSQGAGGQNVNKVSSAIHLRFRIRDSILSDEIKHRLLHMRDTRITRDGILIIKSQSNRTQEMNKQAAFERLIALIETVSITPKTRRPTKPSKTAKKKRLDAKKRQGDKKALRGKMVF